MLKAHPLDWVSLDSLPSRSEDRPKNHRARAWHSGRNGVLATQHTLGQLAGERGDLTAQFLQGSIGFGLQVATGLGNDFLGALLGFSHQAGLFGGAGFAGLFAVLACILTLSRQMLMMQNIELGLSDNCLSGYHVTFYLEKQDTIKTTK